MSKSSRKLVRIAVSLDEDLWLEAKKFAMLKFMSHSQFVRIALDSFIKRTKVKMEKDLKYLKQI